MLDADKIAVKWGIEMNDLIRGDNICIEENRGWFVSIRANVLFQVDMDKEKCECLVNFPDFKYPDFRRNSRCLKCEHLIFAFPDTGDKIWVYNLQSCEISSIEIENPLNVRLMIIEFWKEKDEIYAVSRGLKQILVIDINTQEIKKYYEIPSSAEFVFGNCVKKDGKIFVLNRNSICEFDIDSKSWEINTIPDIVDELFTLVYYDGLFFLTGFKKEIYIWNKKENIIKKINDFPPNFGEYNFGKNIKNEIDYERTRLNYPVFLNSVESKRFIWFLPYQTNHILYLDKETLEINIFDIEEEHENLKSLTRDTAVKYMVLYSKPNGILGVYSHKCKMILEINMEDLVSCYKDIKLDGEKIVEILEANYCIWREYDLGFSEFMRIYKNTRNIETNNENVGKKLHSLM